MSDTAEPQSYTVLDAAKSRACIQSLKRYASSQDVDSIESLLSELQTHKYRIPLTSKVYDSLLASSLDHYRCFIQYAEVWYVDRAFIKSIVQSSIASPQKLSGHMSYAQLLSLSTVNPEAAYHVLLDDYTFFNGHKNIKLRGSFFKDWEILQQCVLCSVLASDSIRQISDAYLREKLPRQMARLMVESWAWSQLEQVMDASLEYMIQTPHDAHHWRDFFDRIAASSVYHTHLYKVWKRIGEYHLDEDTFSHIHAHGRFTHLLEESCISMHSVDTLWRVLDKQELVSRLDIEVVEQEELWSKSHTYAPEYMSNWVYILQNDVSDAFINRLVYSSNIKVAYKTVEALLRTQVWDLAALESYTVSLPKDSNSEFLRRRIMKNLWNEALSSCTEVEASSDWNFAL